jgi:hypothetical protein
MRRGRQLHTSLWPGKLNIALAPHTAPPFCPPLQRRYFGTFRTQHIKVDSLGDCTQFEFVSATYNANSWPQLPSTFVRYLWLDTTLSHPRYSMFWGFVTGLAFHSLHYKEVSTARRCNSKPQLSLVFSEGQTPYISSLQMCGVSLSPLGTSASVRPIAPAPDGRRWWVWNSRWKGN